MNIFRGSRSPLAVAAAAIALVAAIGVLLWVRMNPAAVTFVTDGARPDEWLASHPTDPMDHTVGEVAALTIPRNRSLTLRCADNSLGLGEIVLGTDGVSLFMAFRGPDAATGPPTLGVVTLDSLGERFEHGQALCYALTWPPVAPGASPAETVELRFAVDSTSSEFAQAIAALDNRLLRHEITPPEYTQGVDDALAARWPDLGWRPRWEAP